MSLFTAFAGTLTWLVDALFGNIRPIFNPFLDSRPPTVLGSLPITSPSTTLIAPGVSGGGLFSSWKTFGTRARQNPPKSDVWQPAIADVLHVRELLQKASNGQLPSELVNVILDHAEYWPHVSASKNHVMVARGNTIDEDVLIVRTPPICALATAGCEDESRGLPEPTLLHPARKIIFRIRSHDQGFSGEDVDTQGTYDPSYTWFDAEIDKEFRPMSSDKPLSRIPWVLSSTRFLQHRLYNGEWQELADDGLFGEEEGEDEEDEDEDTISDDNYVLEADDEGGHLIQDFSTSDVVPDASDNSEHMMLPPEEPRMFSHQWLQNHKYEVQFNVQARRLPTEHTIVWRYTDNTEEDSPAAAELRRIGRGRATEDGRFVRCLEVGNCVSLWAKARYPQWANHVESATVEVYFAL